VGTGKSFRAVIQMQFVQVALFIIELKKSGNNSGANPTISSYNSALVKIYSATNRVPHTAFLDIKIISFPNYERTGLLHR
jgi:hypothetical protein